jgi:hypothetical protein
MTTFTAAGEPAGLVEIAQLHGFISVALLGAQLQDLTRTGLEDRNRDDIALIVKYLRHPDLAAE